MWSSYYDRFIIGTAIRWLRYMLFMMEVTFEASREAGIRLPKQIGSAVSIVGAWPSARRGFRRHRLPLVMVVALTGIASFAVPRYHAEVALRLLCFPIIILAVTLGLLGIIAIIVHLCTLHSFGVPYLSPIAPTKQRDMRDVLLRAPLWMLQTRPRLTGDDDRFRQAPDLKPDPSKGGEK